MSHAMYLIARGLKTRKRKRKKTRASVQRNEYGIIVGDEEVE